MSKKFVGKRAELGVYDDAACFTPEERETYAKMLANNSFDTGLNIFNDKLWIKGDDGVEFVINTEPSNESLQRIIDNIIKELNKVND